VKTRYAPSDSIKGGKFLEMLNDYQFLRTLFHGTSQMQGVVQSLNQMHMKVANCWCIHTVTCSVSLPALSQLSGTLYVPYCSSSGS